VDILVNNAGVLRDNLLFKMSEEDWDTVMNVHLKGAFLCSRAAQNTWCSKSMGRIVSLSSTSALGNRGQANYSSAKAALQGLTRTLAIELGPFGITANAVAPGFIDTEMTRSTARRQGLDPDKVIAEASKVIPVRRVGQPRILPTLFASSLRMKPVLSTARSSTSREGHEAKALIHPCNAAIAARLRLSRDARSKR